MKQVKKVFRKENEIMIVTATTKGCNNRQYVSVTADVIEPILRSEAVERCREHLEDGELWKEAVKAGTTELGLQDWADWVIDIDGELAGFDNSLYTNEMNIEGEYYIFDSRSYGCLHDDIKEATNLFDALIKLHLKDSPKDLQKAEKIIDSINDDDIDFEVEKFTRQIIGIED